ncbi:MAG: hypothetical protein IT373_04505 [Polyangiaceae bacterium]|nr:hypothetical protein [Polyangiaceae bacterium]
MTMASRAPRLALGAVELTVPGSARRGRAFFPANRSAALSLDELATELAERFVEQDDHQRLVLLRRALSQRAVTIETYRGETPPHELHAYLRAPEVSDAPLFACVLAPMAVVEHLVSMPPHVVFETATFQALGDPQTSASIIAALEAWVSRVWPGAEVPAIRLSPWPGPVDTPAGTVEILRLFPTTGAQTDASAAAQFSPPSSLVADEFSLPREAA